MTRTVYIEESGTPIYARIAKALGSELARMGMNVLVIKPAAFNHQAFLSFISKQPADSVYLSNAGSNAIQGRLPDGATHYFEHFPGRLIFVHQDSILGGLTFEQGLSRLQAWVRTSARSAHLCIEPDNVDTLLQAGMAVARWVPHASETPPTEPLTEGFEHQASFVGHVVPSVYRQSTGSRSVDALMTHLFARRQKDLSASIQPELQAFTEQSLECLGASKDTLLLRLAYTQWLRGQMMNQSLQFRGWVFENARIEGLEIFGGDPAYLHGVERSLRIERETVHYQPAIYDPQALQQIFRSSLVNINISSLQFDHAVVNRFHDVTLAGGLCLTDRCTGLAQLTRHHDDISFSSVQELEDKVRHFSQPARRNERALLIQAMQRDVMERSGYPWLAREINAVLQDTGATASA